MAPNRQPQRRDSSSSSAYEDAEDAPSKEEVEASLDHQISSPSPKKPAAQNQPQTPKIKPISSKVVEKDPPSSSKLVEKDPPSKSAAKHGSHMAKRKTSNIEVETAKHGSHMAKMKASNIEVETAKHGSDMAKRKASNIEVETAKHGLHMAKRKASNIEVETAKEKEDVKKRLLFTEGDEIVILESMVEYRSKTGLEPRSNIKGFHEFVNKSLSFAGATPTQLYEKVRRLQEKYEKNARGENRRVFVKPHEEKIFELSKKIWKINDSGNGLGNENVRKMSLRGSMGLRKEGQKRMRVDMGSVQIVKDGLEVISESKKVELEGKWEELMVDEIEHYLKKLDLISEQMMLMLEAMKMNGA